MSTAHRTTAASGDTMSDSRRIALTQGIYFAVTGIWPLLHMASFEAVTGPKADRWLVRTVGILVGIVGGVLISAATRDRVTGEVAALGVATAAGLGAVDAVYASRRRIAPVYMLDAAVEAVIVGAWGISSRSQPPLPDDNGALWL